MDPTGEAPQIRLADSADFTDHVQICFSSVSRLQENIFADDEGNASATDWKRTLQTIK